MLEPVTRRPYATDLSDEQWEIIRPLLPEAKSSQGRGRKPTIDRREIVNAVLYWSRSGCAWELLPHDFPSAKTVYSYFRKWQKQGVWQKIHDKLRQQVRCSQQRAQPTAGMIDSQSVKTTDVGGGDRGFDGGKKVRNAPPLSSLNAFKLGRRSTDVNGTSSSILSVWS